MAEENTPLSFLDPLGPEFGRINPPTVDAQGLKPFEGSFLKDPQINFPEIQQIAPRNTYLPNADIKEINRQVPGKKLSDDDWKIQFLESHKAKIKGLANPNDFAKVQAYNSGPDGSAFYKRYAAYGQEKFDKIGFTPFRDNEAIYNSQTSGWNDFTRMMTHSFWPLLTTGFTSGPRSLGKMLRGDFSPDTRDAEIYAEAAAIGQSTKGGIGGFANNLMMNFGYTAGIISEAMLEEAVGALLAAPTGGASFFAATANNMRKIPVLRQVLGAAKTGNVFNQSLKAANNVSNARNFWNAARWEKNLTSGVGGFINPLENTAETLFRLSKTENNLSGLAKASQTFGAFYRDVRGVNMALAEARLEGGMVQNDVYNELYSKHYAETGMHPDDETQKAMWATAKDAGMTTLGWNSALIYASNKVVLDNIVGKKAGFRNFIKSKTDDLVDMKTGKVLKNTKEVTLKTGTKVKDITHEFVERTVFNTGKAFIKQPLAKSVPFAIAYTKANLMEGFQEIGQEVIAKATQDYYINAFTDPDKLATYNYAKGFMIDAIHEQMSMQGLETFASGFFMGTLAGGLNKAQGGLLLGYNKVFNAEKYAEYKEARAKAGKSIENALNSVSIKDFFDSKIWNYGVQSRVNNIKHNVADEKIVRDAEATALAEHLSTILENNAMDSFIEQLESYRGLTDAELAEVFNIEESEAAEYNQKLEKRINQAKEMQKRYDRIMEEFPDPIGPEQLKDFDPATPEGQNAYYLMAAWKQARFNAIKFGHMYDDVKSRMSSITDAMMSIPELKDISSLDLKVLFDPGLLVNTKEILESEIESLQLSTDPSAKKFLKEKKTKLKALSKVEEALNELQAVNLTKEEIKELFLVQNKMKAEDFEIDELKEIVDKEKEKLEAKRGSNLRKFEAAYKEYIRALGGLSQATIFDSTIDQSFAQLYDFYQLDKESQVLTDYINLLYDPGAFAEHVERNMSWMKELYENRKVYYEAQVEAALQQKETNDLLNMLADQNVFISSDDLDNWVNNGTFPEEFIDEANKSVIRQSHPDYFKYQALFLRALQLRNQKENTVPEEFLAKEKQLREEMQEEIEKLEKTEQITSERTVDLKGKKTISLKGIFTQMVPGDYVEVEVKTKDGVETQTFYKADEETLKQDSDSGPAVNIGTKRIYTKGKLYKKTMMPDLAEVQKIEAEYAQKIQKAKEEALAAKETQEKTEEKEAVTNPSFNNLPAIIREQIEDLFDIHLAEKGLDKDTLTDYDAQLEAFSKINAQAAALVNDYIKDEKLKRGTTTGQPQSYSVTLSDGKTADIDSLTKEEVDQYIKDLQFSINTIENLTDEEKAEQANQLLDLQYALKKVKSYYPFFVRKKLTPAQQETVNKIQEFVDKQDKILEPEQNNGKYQVEGQDLERMTSLIEKLLGKEYTYDKESLNKILAAYELLRQSDKYKNQNIATKEFAEAFIEKLKNTKGIKGLNDFAYQKILEIVAKYNSDNNASFENVKEALIDNIGDITFEDSRVAGTYLDNLVRDFFGNKTIEHDEKFISKQAFDALFDPETGQLTKIKESLEKKGFYIFPEGLIVYDLEAGVAGELDLLAVDSNGNTHIIDLKSGEKVKWNNFHSTKPDSYSKKPNYTMQQTGYNNMLHNMIGQESTISLLPVQIQKDSNTGKITTVEPLSIDVKGGILPLNKADVKDKIDQAIPLRVPTTTPVSEKETKPFTPKQILALPKQFEGAVSLTKWQKMIDLINTMTIETSPEVVNELTNILNNLGVQGLSEPIVEFYTQKVKSLQEQEASPEQVSESEIKKGDELVAKKDILKTNNKDIFVTKNATVKIIKVDDVKRTVTLQTVSKNKTQKTITFEELSDNFMSKDKILKGEADAQVEALTPEEVDLLNTATEDVQSFISDPKAVEKAIKKASDTNIETLENDLLNDLDC